MMFAVKMRNIGASIVANRLTRQITLITEKTFERVTIWVHKSTSIQNTIGYIQLADVDSRQTDFDTCRYGINCVSSNLICTGHFRERR